MVVRLNDALQRKAWHPEGMPGSLPLFAVLFSVVGSGCIGWSSPDATGQAFHLPVDEILLDWPYPNLVVEIDYVEPYAPSKLALDELLHVLKTYTVKQEVRILAPTALAPQNGSYTSEDLRAIHNATQDAHDGGATATLHILYLNGRMKEFDHFGIQFASDAVALFPIYFDRQGAGPAVLENSGVGLNREETERSVLVHEVGHAMGLVNHLIPMIRPHEDLGHRAHSNNKASVMYYAIDAGQTGLEDQLNGNFVFEFDEDDKRDLRAFIERRRAAIG